MPDSWDKLIGNGSQKQQSFEKLKQFKHCLQNAGFNIIPSRLSFFGELRGRLNLLRTTDRTEEIYVKIVGLQRKTTGF